MAVRPINIPQPIQTRGSGFRMPLIGDMSSESNFVGANLQLDKILGLLGSLEARKEQKTLRRNLEKEAGLREGALTGFSPETVEKFGTFLLQSGIEKKAGEQKAGQFGESFGQVLRSLGQTGQQTGQALPPEQGVRVPERGVPQTTPQQDLAGTENPLTNTENFGALDMSSLELIQSDPVQGFQQIQQSGQELSPFLQTLATMAEENPQGLMSIMETPLVKNALTEIGKGLGTKEPIKGTGKTVFYDPETFEPIGGAVGEAELPSVGTQYREAALALGLDPNDPEAYTKEAAFNIKKKLLDEQIAVAKAKGENATAQKLAALEQKFDIEANQPLKPSEAATMVLPNGDPVPLGTTLNEAINMGATSLTSQLKTKTEAGRNIQGLLDDTESLVDKIYDKFEKEDIPFVPGGLENRYKQLAGDPDVREYLQMQKLLLAGIARSSGDVGNIAEAEQERYLESFPDIFSLFADDRETAKRKMENIRSMTMRMIEGLKQRGKNSGSNKQTGKSGGGDAELDSLLDKALK